MVLKDGNISIKRNDKRKQNMTWGHKRDDKRFILKLPSFALTLQQVYDSMSIMNIHGIKSSSQQSLIATMTVHTRCGCHFIQFQLSNSYRHVAITTKIITKFS